MLIKRIPAGVYAANCYILVDEESRECAVIDPGGDAEDLVSFIDETNAKVKYILLTHGHVDHTGAVGYFSEVYGVQAHIHKDDGMFISNGEFMFGPLKYKGNIVELAMDLEQDKVFSLGGLEIKCIETPGHTPGGVCFLVQDKLFTGDTLFLRSIGRTDLSGGNFNTLIDSINNRLLTLNPETVVYPGHGPQTSIRYERDNNPFL